MLKANRIFSSAEIPRSGLQVSFLGLNPIFCPHNVYTYVFTLTEAYTIKLLSGTSTNNSDYSQIWFFIALRLQLLFNNQKKNCTTCKTISKYFKCLEPNYFLKKFTLHFCDLRHLFAITQWIKNKRVQNTSIDVWIWCIFCECIIMLCLEKCNLSLMCVGWFVGTLHFQVSIKALVISFDIIFSLYTILSWLTLICNAVHCA